MNIEKRSFVLDDEYTGLKKTSTFMIVLALPVVTIFFAWCTIGQIIDTIMLWKYATISESAISIALSLVYASCSIIYPWKAFRELRNRKSEQSHAADGENAAADT